MSDVLSLEKDLEATKQRMTKVETTLDDIKAELKAKSIADARIEQILETMQGTIQLVQGDTREIRNEMMKLVMKAIEQNQKDDHDEKTFYRKLVIGAVTILATIVLSAFGISKLMPIFGGG